MRWLGLAGSIVVLAAAGSAAPALAQESTGTIAGHLTDAGAPVSAIVFVDGFDTGFFSGGVADRDKAMGVKVKSGATRTYDLALGVGATITGKVSSADGSQSHSARVTFVNADTGEEIGVGDIFRAPFAYTAHVAGPQKVKIRYNGSVNGDEYAGYVGGPDFAHAIVFTISGTGSRAIDVVMTNFAP